jgi:hypothetical protein
MLGWEGGSDTPKLEPLFPVKLLTNAGVKCSSWFRNVIVFQISRSFSSPSHESAVISH